MEAIKDRDERADAAFSTATDVGIKPPEDNDDRDSSASLAGYILLHTHLTVRWLAFNALLPTTCVMRWLVKSSRSPRVSRMGKDALRCASINGSTDERPDQLGNAFIYDELTIGVYPSAKGSGADDVVR